MRFFSSLLGAHRHVLAFGLLIFSLVFFLMFSIFEKYQHQTDDLFMQVQPVGASEVLLLDPNYPVVMRNDERDSLSNPDITAQSAIVMDVVSQAVLFEKNAFEPRPPASVTKLMTALVARDAYFLDQVLKTDLPMHSAGSVIDYSLGEEQTVRGLLKASLIQSGNDAAEVLAARYPGGAEAFVQAMNDRAAILGLQESSFRNPTGLDSQEHVMSARDITFVFAKALEDTFLRDTLTQSQALIYDSTGTLGRTIYNTNQLLWTEYVLAGKTGTTEAAGQVLTTLVLVNGHEVIITVAGSKDRYTDTIALYRWLEQAYSWVDPSDIDLLHYTENIQ